MIASTSRMTMAMAMILTATILLGSGVAVDVDVAARGDNHLETTTTTGSIIPVPSAAQLRYQSTDFVALIHFNMATYAHDGDPGCDATNWNQKAPYATGPTRTPETFRPSKLNTTQWFDSITALGANIAVLTAKHGCGFLLWPTKAQLPNQNPKRVANGGGGGDDGVPYGYHTDFDLLQQFVDSAKASGVGYGFYYSIMKNFLLCRSFFGGNSCTERILDGQHNVTDDEYHEIVRTHLTEIYTRYGRLTEVWMDSRLQGFGSLLDHLQPTAGGTPSNPRDWCGTESGFPSRDLGGGPIWQTGTGPHGNASDANWVDKFCDPQLFKDHVWFYEPGRRVRTLAELIPIYHDIVGRGMVMELAFAINRDGLVEESHERAYGQLGQWVRDCYGTPVRSVEDVAFEGGQHALKLILALPLPDSDEVAPPGNNNDLEAALSMFDRIVVREDISVGQRIRNYTITLVREEDDEDDTIVATLVSDGTSVGRKRIHLLDSESVSVANNDALQPQQYNTESHLGQPRRPLTRNTRMSVVLTVTHAIAPPRIAFFGVYEPCYPVVESSNHHHRPSATSTN